MKELVQLAGTNAGGLYVLYLVQLTGNCNLTDDSLQ